MGWWEEQSMIQYRIRKANKVFTSNPNFMAFDMVREHFGFDITVSHNNVIRLKCIWQKNKVHDKSFEFRINLPPNFHKKLVSYLIFRHVIPENLKQLFQGWGIRFYIHVWEKIASSIFGPWPSGKCLFKMNSIKTCVLIKTMVHTLTPNLNSTMNYKTELTETRYLPKAL